MHQREDYEDDGENEHRKDYQKPEQKRQDVFHDKFDRLSRPRGVLLDRGCIEYRLDHLSKRGVLLDKDPKLGKDKPYPTDNRNAQDCKK